MHFKMALARPARFPLYLRVPGWCHKAAADINGAVVTADAMPGTYLVLDREWKDGDRVRLRLPMALRVKTWTKNQNAVSVEYGPLTLSLKIGEKCSRYGGTKDWPEVEVFPTTPWNYGLVVDPAHPPASLHLVRRPAAVADDPFTPATVPLEVTAKAKRIPRWTMDRNGLVGKLAPSPVRSAEPVETVTLIPMGAARLRITVFPRIGTGPDAHDWPPPPASTK
jgi:hypothetical protein